MYDGISIYMISQSMYIRPQWIVETANFISYFIGEVNGEVNL